MEPGTFNAIEISGTQGTHIVKIGSIFGVSILRPTGQDNGGLDHRVQLQTPGGPIASGLMTRTDAETFAADIEKHAKFSKLCIHTASVAANRKIDRVSGPKSEIDEESAEEEGEEYED